MVDYFQKLVHITAETGAILGEIQSYLLSQDIAENKCPTRTTAIECNASEDDTALISQKSQVKAAVILIWWNSELFWRSKFVSSKFMFQILVLFFPDYGH